MLNENQLVELLVQYKNKSNTQGLIELVNAYQPLLIKMSMINGKYNEDLHSEMKIRFIQCINSFHLYT